PPPAPAPPTPGARASGTRRAVPGSAAVRRIVRPVHPARTGRPPRTAIRG
ncbi:hypothetical protein GA0115247_105118, partial [Streptomyces sp. PalvLS-984]